jgi:hypothetical protein
MIVNQHRGRFVLIYLAGLSLLTGLCGGSAAGVARNML